MIDFIVIVLVLNILWYGVFSNESIAEYHKSRSEEYSERLRIDGEYFKDKYGICYVGHHIGERDTFLASVPCDKVGL